MSWPDASWHGSEQARPRHRPVELDVTNVVAGLDDDHTRL